MVHQFKAPTLNVTKCGYLYNWYAATAGTGTYDTSTEGTNVSGSICPTGWRLPSTMSDGSTATGNGTSFTAADFPVLNASMNAGSLTTGSTTSSYYANWLFTGAWSGVFSGGWLDGFYNQGSYGYYWSSTASSSAEAGNLYFYSSFVYPGYSVNVKYNGRAVRCVMDGVNLADDLPDTINPDNYTSSNPAIVDVYPTTGWTGDVIAITSDAQFNNVTDVTIGGTSCSPYQVISDSLIACKLPSKSANTFDGYAVAVTTSTGTVDMHNFTVRYFNPSRTETVGSSTTSNITMQDFTQSNCNAMTVGQVVSLTDERNGQTYRVKKMQDNKCWMVDNMKYLGEGITISNVDSTTGITYNNSDKYNTVDGTDTQSTANSDKAFYNNPMSDSYCYGTSIQSSYTKCGYLYNWYAATAGTGTYNVSTGGTNVSGSICPTGWRLPSATSDGSTATGDGTSYTAADFAVLNASMNAGALTAGSTTSYPTGWQFTGAWSGVFSGSWYGGFYYQGSNGYYWSSTAFSSTYARHLYFYSSGVGPGNNGGKYSGFAIRCVLP